MNYVRNIKNLSDLDGNYVVYAKKNYFKAASPSEALNNEK